MATELSTSPSIRWVVLICHFRLLEGQVPIPAFEDFGHVAGEQAFTDFWLANRSLQRFGMAPQRCETRRANARRPAPIGPDEVFGLSTQCLSPCNISVTPLIEPAIAMTLVALLFAVFHGLAHGTEGARHRPNSRAS